MILLPPTHYFGQLRYRVFRDEQLAPNGDPIAPAVFDSGFQNNLILNTFYDKSCSGTGSDTANASRAQLLGYMAASTETTGPTATDNSLGASQINTRFARYSPADTFTVSGNKLIQTQQYRTTKGQVQGTVGKVAIFESLTGGTMNVASLIKDEGGVPTTLPLGPNDYLYVDWKVETTVNLTPVTGTIVVPTEGTFNYELKPAYWNALGSSPLACINGVSRANNGLGYDRVIAYTGGLGAVTAGPSGSSEQLDITPTAAPYTSGSKQRGFTYTAGEPGFNLAGGVRSLRFSNSSGGGGYQISFSRTTDGAPLNKINTKKLIIAMTWAFS
jgi:hypothetical protein